jgi:hypothetical protein
VGEPQRGGAWIDKVMWIETELFPKGYGVNEYNDLLTETAIDIRYELDRNGGGAPESLLLALADPLLTATAAKAAVGIASSFAGRALYDRWKATRKKEDVDRLGDEVLTKRQVERDPQLVDQARIDVVELLTAHGLTSEQAERVTSRLVERMRTNADDQGH